MSDRDGDGVLPRPTLTPDRRVPFVDAHIHLWELARFPYRWLRPPCRDDVLGDYRAICEDWPPQRMLAEIAGVGVRAWIHVEADSGAADPVDETRWLEAVAAVHGGPAAIVVTCDLGADDVARELERHLAASERVRGVRIRQHPDDATPAFHAGLAALARLGLSYELSASPGTLALAREHLRRHPDLHVVVGHAGSPERLDHGYLEHWRRELHALAELERVTCKISGFSAVDHAWTVDSLRPLVLDVIDAFGVERVVFGTDWPVASLFATYAEQVDAYRLILDAAGFSLEDQARMLHANAARAYGIGDDGSSAG